MPDGIEIINEGHVNEFPIGRLTDADGKTILVWKNNTADAFLQAVGPVPQPPSLGLGGRLQVVGFDTRGQPTGYVYDPSGDELNKQQVEIYKARLEAWNQRASQVQKAIELMLK